MYSDYHECEGWIYQFSRRAKVERIEGCIETYSRKLIFGAILKSIYSYWAEE